MLDFINLDMLLDMDIFLKNTIKDVMTWFHVYGEIIQMLNPLNLNNVVLIIRVR
jgi:hypothetical protein